jgi:hypothetical protein
MYGIDNVIDYLAARAVDPIPRFILLKEILKTASNSDTYRKACEEVKQSKWYRQLAGEQWEDGSWGRFHTQDTKSGGKQFFKTTEAAICRMKELSLDCHDSMVVSCIHLMERYLTGAAMWPDKIEHHDGFIIALNTIVAANLSLLDPDNSLLLHKRRICAENLEKAFQNGYLDENRWESENRNSSEILLRIYMVHPIRLLQHNYYLKEDLQRQFLNYFWTRQEGIYYISRYSPSAIQSHENTGFQEWLRCLEELSGFTLFYEFLQRDGIYEHLLKECFNLMDENVTLSSTNPVYGHYSESWREKYNRADDLILRILRLLIQCKDNK